MSLSLYGIFGWNNSVVKVCIEFLEGITVPFSLWRIFGGNNSVVKVCIGLVAAELRTVRYISLTNTQ